MDCFGVLTQVAKALGLSNADVRDYKRIPDGDRMERGLSEHMIRLDDWRDAREGDILHISFGLRRPQHIAFLTGHNRILHAYMKNKCVVEHEMDAEWHNMIRAAYAFKGVA